MSFFNKMHSLDTDRIKIEYLMIPIYTFCAKHSFSFVAINVHVKSFIKCKSKKQPRTAANATKIITYTLN